MCENCCNMGCKYRFMTANERHFIARYSANQKILVMEFHKIWKVVCKKYQPDGEE